MDPKAPEQILELIDCGAFSDVTETAILTVDVPDGSVLGIESL